MPSIHLIVIKTGKLDAQSAFYASLGFQFDYHKHGGGPFHYASVGGSTVLEIYPLPRGVTQADNTTRLGFTVENLDGLIEQLQSQGTRIITPPVRTEWGYTAVVEDLDGRKIELTEK